MARYPMGQSGVPAATVKKYLEKPLILNICGIAIPFAKVNENGTVYPEGRGTLAVDASYTGADGKQHAMSIVTMNGALYFKVDTLQGLGKLVDDKAQSSAGHKLF